MEPELPAPLLECEAPVLEPVPMLLEPDIELPLGEPEVLPEVPDWDDWLPDFCAELDEPGDDCEVDDCWFDWLPLFKLDSEPCLLPVPSFGFCVSMISFPLLNVSVGTRQRRGADTKVFRSLGDDGAMTHKTIWSFCARGTESW